MGKVHETRAVIVAFHGVILNTFPNFIFTFSYLFLNIIFCTENCVLEHGIFSNSESALYNIHNKLINSFLL